MSSDKSITPALPSRAAVIARLPDGFAKKIHFAIGGQGDLEWFADRLVHILVRYERYRAHETNLTRSDLRKAFTKVRGKADGFLQSLSELDPEVLSILESYLEGITLSSRYESFDFDDPDSVLPCDDTSLDQAREATTSIVEACSRGLKVLEASAGEKKKSKQLGLNQAIVDLAALYEDQTGKLASTACYRDETCEDEYNGAFFVMVRQILDTYAPTSYSTPTALGIRILRQTKRD